MSIQQDSCWLWSKLLPKGWAYSKKMDASQCFISKKESATISKLVSNLLSKDVGDRVAPISYYQEESSRYPGEPWQNAFNYLI